MAIDKIQLTTYDTNSIGETISSTVSNYITLSAATDLTISSITLSTASSPIKIAKSSGSSTILDLYNGEYHTYVNATLNPANDITISFPAVSSTLATTSITTTSSTAYASYGDGIVTNVTYSNNSFELQTKKAGTQVSYVLENNILKIREV